MRNLIASLFVFIATAFQATAEVDIQEVTSPGGIKAWLVEEHAIPFVALEIGFRGGTSLDPEDKEGVTNLMTALLEEGSGEMDATEFLQMQEALAADFQFSAGRDSLSVSARILSENREEALALLKQAISQPLFNEAAVERVRSQVLSGLREDETDPETLANRTMNELAYPGQPYGRPGDGTIASVQALSRDDISAAHKATMSRDKLVVTVVGDMSAAELAPLLDDLFSELPETGAPLPPKTEFQAGGGLTIVEFDTPQSVALLAHKGIERHDPDFFPAFVLTRIFGGGGFSSRLMDEVREKRGLTYGVYAWLDPGDLAHQITASVASANDRIAESLSVIKDEWARMATGEVTDKELEDAQKYLTGAFPLRFDSNSKIASMLLSFQMQDLPIDYVKTRNDKVNAVTKEDIARIAKRLMKPEELRIVVVGKPEGLAE